MEQKHLDEVEESFFGEEFIDDDDFLTPKTETKKIVEDTIENSDEIKIEPVKKKTTKKVTTKKVSKKKEEKEIKTEEKKEAEDLGLKSLKSKEEKKVETKNYKDDDKDNKKEELIASSIASSVVSKESKPKIEVKKEETKLETKETKENKEKKPIETTPTYDPWDEPETESTGLGISMWKIIAGIAVVLLLFSIFTDGFNFGTTGAESVIASGDELSLQEAGQKALEYVNNNLLQAPFVATVESSSDEGNLYKITLDVAGEKVDSYITKDGSLFFPQGFAVTGSPVVELDAGNEEVKFVEATVDDDPMLGNKDAPVTIIEFSDYECPFCGKFRAETFDLIKTNYIDTGKANIVFRDFPLPSHSNAFSAALAAECADDQGKYWEYHDVLFENQGELNTENYKKWAKDLALNEDKFNKCLDSEEHKEEVQKDMKDGEASGVSGTPFFFINGKMLSGALPYEEFKAEIDVALGTQEPAKEVESEETKVKEPVKEPENTGNIAQISISAKKWIFTPNELTVSKGDTVRLKITPQNHYFTFSLPAFEVVRKVDGVTEVEFVADKVGEFDFTCSTCEDWRGMKGTLTVR